MVKGKIALIGLAVGALALLMGLVHFWAGPFAPQKPVETSIAEAAVEIRDAAMRAMKGEEPPPPERAEWNIDRTIETATGSFGGLAIVLAMVGFVAREPKRNVAGAVFLGASALAFQFFTWFALALIGAILSGALLTAFGDFFDFG